MKLHELKTVLAAHPTAEVRFQLPGGEFAPAHSHVTEVARIDKRFIDCGGTLRTETICRLQTWSADDTDHRLTAGKLAKILTKAESVLLTDDLDVDIEHEVGVITQFPLGAVTSTDKQLIFQLTERHTACLAMDKCLPPTAARSDLNPMKFDFTGTSAPNKCC
jgi:hypothetical protein